MQNRWIAFTTFVLVGCQEARVPSEVRSASGRATFELTDAGHGFGNQHFFFLPPLVAAPTYSGVADSRLSPIVEICAIAGRSCASPSVATFTTTTGPGAETVRFNAADGSYVVSWKTGDFNLDLTRVYRIQVRVGLAELGHADVVLISNGSAKNATTGDAIALVDGKTLPIKFRIEQGALTSAVVGQSGGAVRSADGNVTLNFPAGALSGETTVSLQPLGASALDLKQRVIPGTVYAFQPSPMTFGSTVSLTLAFDPASLASGARFGDLRLAKANHLADGRVAWRIVPGSGLVAGTNSVSGQISTFSEYAVVSPRQIAYGYANASQDNSSGIFLINEDGTGLTRLTTGCDGTPAWSPDGMRLVFTRLCAADPGPQLWTINADGTGEHSLGIAGFGADWSPDGTRLVFEVPVPVAPNGMTSEVYVANTDGSARRRLMSAMATALDMANGPYSFFPTIWSGVHTRSPKWSPDGTTIVYSNWNAIFAVAPDGNNLRELTAGLGSPFAGMPGSPGYWDTQGFSWPADSRTLVFGCVAELVTLPNNPFVCSMRSDGTGSYSYIIPADGDVTMGSPSLSADGTKVAFMYGQGRVSVINADGSGLVVLAPEENWYWAPVWRP